MRHVFAVLLLTVAGLPAAAGAAPDGIRLTPAPAEASTALFRGWDDPKSDHHPLFAADDDAKTGWVEGAEGDGVGEWVRFHVTPVRTGALRIALRNGCQRTGRTFGEYGRVEKATVVVQPGGDEAPITLEDRKDWQTFEVPVPRGRLAAVELRIESVYPGKGGGEHTCLADVRLAVPEGTAVDAAGQRTRAKQVEGWIDRRREAGKLLDSPKGRRALPFAPRYIARADGQDMALDCGQDQICFIEEGLRALKYALGAEAPPEIERALQLMADEAGWRAVTLTVADARPVPPIDGLCSDDGIDTWPCDRGVYLPSKLGLLSREGVQATPVKLIPTVRQLGDPETCTTYGIDRVTFARPTPGVPSAVISLECVKGVGGAPPRNSMQLWVYDREGRLTVSASPREAAALWWSAPTDDGPARLEKARKLVIRTGHRTTIEPEVPIAP